ncbi:hypothetical protein [uncultured Microbulbifer sp.]|uniref:hypothetical protein n=1 Tax=uncultured Microbulbifer sp. TaxID=348147 RepID=UPI0026284197|nr:hypothetical protein [uncultured Microbulbifer sp.]
MKFTKSIFRIFTGPEVDGNQEVPLPTSQAEDYPFPDHPEPHPQGGIAGIRPLGVDVAQDNTVFDSVGFGDSGGLGL